MFLMDLKKKFLAKDKIEMQIIIRLLQHLEKKNFILETTLFMLNNKLQ